MLEETPYPERCGQMVLWDADFFTLEILRSSNPGLPVYKKGRMSEHAQGKERDCYEARPRCALVNDISRQRYLRGIKIRIFEHAKKDFDGRKGDTVEVDPLSLNQPVDDRAKARMIPTCQCNFKLTHKKRARSPFGFSLLSAGRTKSTVYGSSSMYVSCGPLSLESNFYALGYRTPLCSKYPGNFGEFKTELRTEYGKSILQN